jgi:chaperonin cofactor prefoldin
MMPRSVSFAIILTFFAAFSAAAQSQDSSALPSATSQDATPPAETKKPTKVWTNEDIAHKGGGVSVVGDPKNKPKLTNSKPVNAQYVESVRKQLDKLQGQIADIDKQLVDLKNFNSGEPSTTASGVQLNKSYQREPIEVQMRALQDKKKDLESKVDALLDEARKKGVDSSQLR